MTVSPPVIPPKFTSFLEQATQHMMNDMGIKDISEQVVVERTSIGEPNQHDADAECRTHS